MSKAMPNEDGISDPVSAFTVAGQALLGALHPLPKGIRLLGLGLHNLVEHEIEAPIQLGLEI